MSLFNRNSIRPEDMLLLVSQDAIDAERYRKLRRWMSSNVEEGWKQVENLGAIGAYVDWDAFDAYLDELPVCNVGLCNTGPQNE